MGLCVTFFFFRFVLRSHYSPEGSKYTVLVSRRLNPVEKQGTRPGVAPTVQGASGTH